MIEEERTSEAELEAKRAKTVSEVEAARLEPAAANAPHLQAQPPTADEVRRCILTVWADEVSMRDPELFQNVITRIRERATLHNFFIDGNGRRWARTNTEAQARRVQRRVADVRVLGGRATLRAQLMVPALP